MADTTHGRDLCACGASKQTRSKQCSSCAGGHRTGATETMTVDGNTCEIGVKTAEPVKTLEDLIRVCNIDTQTWQVDKWTANRWEMSGEGQFQVKANLRRRVEVIAVREEIEALKDDAKRGIAPMKAKAPRHASGLALEVSIPDLHIGKLAWADETGWENYDTKIAIQTYEAALSALLSRVRGHKFEKIILPVGNDFFHSDTKAGTTTAGTILDTDSRYQKSFTAGRRLVVSAIERLRKIAPVDVIIVPGNHDCHDMETELLTRRGWKRFHEIDEKADKILSVDTETGRAIWSDIIYAVKRPHAGDMLHIGGRVDMAITPYHRVLMKSVHKRHPSWRYLEGRDLPTTFMAMAAASSSSNAGVDLSDDQIALAGWIATDGSIRRIGNNIQISIFQSKPNTEIERLLGALGLQYKKSTRTRNIESIRGRTLIKRPLPQNEWRLDAQSSRTVAQYATKATVPDWCHDLNDAQWGVFLDAVMAGDGHWTATKRRASRKTSGTVYGTHDFLSSLQAVALQHGWRAWISPSREAWKLNLAKTTNSHVTPKHVSTVAFEGDTWCLVTKHRNFFVRRNGKAHCSGNSLSAWHLGDSLECLYHSTQGVTIDNEPKLRKYFRFGKVMVMLTHGNKGKLPDYPLVMATEQPAMFGETTFREVHTGDKHQLRVQEHHGVKVRISPALCPPDAWHSEHQFVGMGRSAEAFIWDAEEGLIGTAYYTVPTDAQVADGQ